MDCRDTSQNPTSSDTSKNDSVDKTSVHNFADSTVQNVTSREATTSSQDHLSDSSKRDERNIAHSDYVNSGHFINVTPNPLFEHQLVATSNSNSIPNGPDLKEQNGLTLFNSILNENVFNADLNHTLDSNYSNDSTVKEILNSNSNDTTLRANPNSTPNNYDHLGARPKTPLNTEPKES